jgi:hypothetical protein
MKHYQLNGTIRLLLHDDIEVNQHAIGAYEELFRKLLPTIAISRSGVLEIANLNKHRIIQSSQKIHASLSKRYTPPFCFFIFKN